MVALRKAWRELAAACDRASDARRPSPVVRRRSQFSGSREVDPNIVRCSGVQVFRCSSSEFDIEGRNRFCRREKVLQLKGENRVPDDHGDTEGRRDTEERNKLR
jgi:hypothetical protein